MVSCKRIALILCFLCFLSVAIIVAVTLALWTGPMHASCNVDWTFGMSCAEVSKALVDQMEKWKTADNCKSGGQRCLYKMLSHTETQVKGTHETPVKHYIDDLTFTLEHDNNNCKAHGVSTSETWYAILDYGTNYCNLHNLVTGAGLDKIPGYSENTADTRCTQYSSANCDIY